MNSMTINAFDDTSDADKFWLALAISLLLHSSLYYGLPYLRSEPVPPVERIEVVLNTLMQPQAEAPAPPAPPPPQVEPVPEKPKPVVKPVQKPEPKKEKVVEAPKVLATEAPAEIEDYVVPAAPVPEEPAPVAESEPEPVISESPPPSNNTSPAANLPVASAPAISPSSTQSTEATPAEAWNGYGQLLYNLVGKNKNYPQIAVRRNWEGEVKIYAKFMLGKLVEATIVTSSGHVVLDEEALAMVRKAATQIPVKGELAKKSFTVTIPVAFKLFS